MEENIPISLRFRIFQASSKLVIDDIASRAIRRLAWVAVLQIYNLPQAHLIANDVLMQVLFMLYSIRALVLEKDRKKAREKAGDEVTTMSIWLLIIMSLYNTLSPLYLPWLTTWTWRTFWTTNNCLIYTGIVAVLVFSKIGPRFALKLIGYTSRGFRLFSWTVGDMLVLFYFQTVDWILERRFRFVQFFGRLIGLAIEGQIVLHSCWALLIGLYMLYARKSYSEIWQSLPGLPAKLLFFYPALFRALHLQTWTPIRLRRGAKENLPEYEYTELEENQIRLLLLYPRHPQESLRCSMFKTTLSSAPPFEAISYCWGTPANRSSKVSVNGHHVLVTPNAVEVLKKNTSYFLPKLVWIDGICIDQDDEFERAEQVKMMHDIYRKATVVSVTLLQDSRVEEHKRAIMNTLKIISNPNVKLYLNRIIPYFEFFLNREYSAFEVELINFISANRAADLITELKYCNYCASTQGPLIYKQFARQATTQRFEAFRALLSNPWFQRMWVVQEVALAHSIRVHYGSIVLGWDDLRDALEIFARYPELITLLQVGTDEYTRHPLPHGVLAIDTIENIRTKIRKDAIRTLADILWQCREFISGDPRDRLFAIRGMCSYLPNDLLEPDYEHKTETVFENAAICLINDGCAARLLSRCDIGYFAGSKLMFNLPSWVPDWTKKRYTADLSFVNKDTDYNAGGPYAMDLQIKPKSVHKITAVNGGSLLREVPSLIVNGYSYDVIAELADSWDSYGPLSGSWELTKVLSANINLYFSTYRMVKKSRLVRDPYLHVKNQSVREAFWRTITGNRTAKINPLPKSMAKKFKMYESFTKKLRSREIPLLDKPTGEVAWGDIFKLAPLQEFSNSVMRCWIGRRVCITKKGLIGIVPTFSKLGDKIVVIPEMQTPLILRECGTQDSSKYQIVGECYIHGIMNEEIFQYGLLQESLEII